MGNSIYVRKSLTLALTLILIAPMLLTLVPQVTPAVKSEEYYFKGLREWPIVEANYSASYGFWVGTEFVWIDQANDDVGSTKASSTGYYYPTNETVYGPFANATGKVVDGKLVGPGGPADILQFRVYTSPTEDYVYFLVVLNNVTSVDAVAFTIAVDTGEGGMDWIEPHADVWVGSHVMYAIAFFAGHLGIRYDGWKKAPGDLDPSTVAKVTYGYAADGHFAVEIAVKKSFIGDPIGKAWKFVVIAGCPEPSGDGWDEYGWRFAEINPTADAVHPGGGVSGWPEPNWFDMTYNGTFEQQLELMNMWKSKELGDSEDNCVNMWPESGDPKQIQAWITVSYKVVPEKVTVEWSMAPLPQVVKGTYVPIRVHAEYVAYFPAADTYVKVDARQDVKVKVKVYSEGGKLVYEDSLKYAYPGYFYGFVPTANLSAGTYNVTVEATYLNTTSYTSALIKVVEAPTEAYYAGLRVWAPYEADYSASYGVWHSGEFIWVDQAFDDVGSTKMSETGYYYPTNETIYGPFANATGKVVNGKLVGPGGPADLLQLRVYTAPEDEYVYFLVVLNNVTSVEAVGFTIVIYTGETSAMDWVEPHADLKLSEGEKLANYGIAFFGGELAIIYDGWEKMTPDEAAQVAKYTFGYTPDGHFAVEIAVKKSFIGDPIGRTWYILLPVGVNSPNDIKPGDWPGFDHVFAEVRSVADAIHPGGGIDDWWDPNFFDIAYNGTFEDQLNFTNGWAYPSTGKWWEDPIHNVGDNPKAWIEVSFKAIPKKILLSWIKAPPDVAAEGTSFNVVVNATLECVYAGEIIYVPMEGGNVTLEIVKDSETVKVINMKMTAPGRYEATIDTTGLEGKYKVVVVAKYENIVSEPLEKEFTVKKLAAGILFQGAVQWPIVTEKYDKSYATYVNGAFVWIDQANDDVGSTCVSETGYYYPLNKEVYGDFAGATGKVVNGRLVGPGGPADILEFRVYTTPEDEYVYFLVVLNNVPDVRAVGFTIVIGSEKGSMDWIEPHADLHIGGGKYLAEYQIAFFGGEVGIRYGNWKYISPPQVYDYVKVVYGKTSNGHFAVEIAVKKSLVGDPLGKEWHVMLIAGVNSPNDIRPGDWPGFDHVFAEVKPSADEIHPGGGIDGWWDPNFFDVAFNGTFEDQLNFMNSWNPEQEHACISAGKVEQLWLTVKLVPQIPVSSLNLAWIQPPPEALLVGSRLKISVTVNITTCVGTVCTSKPATNATVTAYVISEDGKTVATFDLKHIGNGVYEGETTAPGPGKYTVKVVAKCGELTGELLSKAFTVKELLPPWIYTAIAVIIIIGIIAIVVAVLYRKGMFKRK